MGSETDFVALWNKDLVERVGQGDSDSMYALAILYEDGNLREEDAKIAMELYEKAANLGNVDAIAKLGLMYAKGEKVPQDIAKGEALCRQAAALGQPYAIGCLSLMCARGEEVPQDLKKAEILGKEAADLDYCVALNELARMYEEGEKVPQDCKKAQEIRQMRIECQRTYAINTLASLYGDARGIPNKDLAMLAMTEELYRKVAEKGDAHWLFFLGVDYIEGVSVPQDIAKGIALCQEAIAFESSMKKPRTNLRFCFAQRYGGGNSVSQKPKDAQFQKKL